MEGLTEIMKVFFEIMRFERGKDTENQIHEQNVRDEKKRDVSEKQLAF